MSTREALSTITCPTCGVALIQRERYERDRTALVSEPAWMPIGKPRCPDGHRIDWTGIAPVAAE